MSRPGHRNIESASRLYDRLCDWKRVNETISSYFGDHPLNTNEKVVVIKVILINGLYNANVKEPLRMARHALQLRRLDVQLEAGEIEAVEELARCDRNYVSFASKFCHFHNKGAYPICDSYVKEALRLLHGRRLYNNDYREFFEAIRAFRDSLGLESLTWEDLDKYLWLYGQKKALDKGNKAIGKEVKALYQDSGSKHLFEELEP